MYGDEEFLPRAPDPEEIIIEGDNPTDPSPSIVQEFSETASDHETVDDESQNETVVENQESIQNEQQPNDESN